MGRKNEGASERLRPFPKSQHCSGSTHHIKGAAAVGSPDVEINPCTLAASRSISDDNDANHVLRFDIFPFSLSDH